MQKRTVNKKVLVDGMETMIEVEELVEISSEEEVTDEEEGSEGDDDVDENSDEAMMKKKKEEEMKKELERQKSFQVLPWAGSVPIRKNEAGTRSKIDKKFAPPPPLGNSNSVPRIYHSETLQWVKETLLDPSNKNSGLFDQAERCFCGIFNSFDRDSDGVLNSDEIEALDCTVGSKCGTPQALEYLVKFRRGSSR